jgi:membrane-associated phospholipid phosphatase
MRKIRSTSLLRSSELPWIGGMVAALAMLATAVTESGTVDRLDAETSRMVEDRATHHATEWNFLITHLGSTEIVVLLTLSAIAALALTKHWRGVFALATAVVATQAVVQLMKLIVERPRPGQSLIEATGFSFPSGHAATSVAFYGTLALIGMRACRTAPARVAIAAAAALVVLAVGGTRIYLGAHYPTDVVAGWLTGGILMLGCWLAASRIEQLNGRASAV